MKRIHVPELIEAGKTVVGPKDGCAGDGGGEAQDERVIPGTSIAVVQAHFDGVVEEIDFGTDSP